MSKKKREDANVNCPFYKGDGEKKLVCSGIVGTTTINTFKNQTQLDEHKNDFCIDFYRSCPMYQALELKVEDSEYM